MCNVRFIGCLHFGHEAMAKFRGFNVSYYHDQYLIQQWNKVVNKKDLTYIVGDVTMETSKHYHLLDKLKGRKIVVLGNHDLPRDIKELLRYVESVGGMIKYKGNVLTHCPIHPNEVYGCRYNIHAHIHHNNKLEDCIVGSKYQNLDSIKQSTINKYICVDAKLLNFTPRTLEELIK